MFETVAILCILVTLVTFVLLLSLFGGQPSQMQKLCRSGDMVLFVGWEGWVELILTFRLLAALLVPQKKQHSCKSRTDS